jgi:hypothetical protein
VGSDTRTGSIPVCGTIKSSDSYESELFFHFYFSISRPHYQPRRRPFGLA